MTSENAMKGVRIEIFRYEHPVDGVMFLAIEGAVVRFFCRWPFGRKTDKWIDIANEFNYSTYREAVAALPGTRSVQIKGTRSGHISFKILSPKTIRLVVVGEGERPRQFVKKLEMSAEDLLPR